MGYNMDTEAETVANPEAKWGRERIEGPVMLRVSGELSPNYQWVEHWHDVQAVNE
jgi:hypothetical protein